MPMALTFTAVKEALESLLKLKNAFTSLRASNYFARELSISTIVESFFAFEPLPQHKVKIVGKISPYVMNTRFPIYVPRDVKDVSVGPELVQYEGKNVAGGALKFTTHALGVPAINFNPIRLQDGYNARLLWLYPQAAKGLNFPFQTGKFDINNLSYVFNVRMEDKPIPILLDPEIPVEPFLYKTVTVIGKIITTPVEHFEILSRSADPFTLNFYSNCIRPFSGNEGILAIDGRRPEGKIDRKDSKPAPFEIVYTVQALIDLPSDDDTSMKMSEILGACVDGIPDRQGLPLQIKTIKDGTSHVGSIITIGDISWQYSEQNRCFGAFTVLDAADPVGFQTGLTKLAAHWNTWQKISRR
jgi:hypothetical protein